MVPVSRLPMTVVMPLSPTNPPIMPSESPVVLTDPVAWDALMAPKLPPTSPPISTLPLPPAGPVA